MATYKEVTTVGTIEWARVFENNRDMEGYKGEYQKYNGAYTVDQVLSKEEYQKLVDAGSQKKPKQSRILDTGEIAIRMMRPHQVIKTDGTEVDKAGGAPEVTDVDGNPINERIGNGTKAEITNLISSFKGQDGKVYSRTTMTKIKILELVPYEEKEAEMAW
jgi:hypothetical protein